MGKWKIIWWILGAIFVIPVAIRFTIWIATRIIRAFTGGMASASRKIDEDFEEKG